MTLNKCEDRVNLPTLGFIFKGYTKNGKDEAFELLLTPDDYVLEFEVDGRNDCVIGIGSDNEDSGWTLGQVFLRAYYTVFDRESEAVGFVKSNPDPGRVTEVSEITKNTQKAIPKIIPTTTQSIINPNGANMNTQNSVKDGAFKASSYFNGISPEVIDNKLMSFLKNNQ